MFPTLTEKLDPAIYKRNMSELADASGVQAILTPDDFASELRALVKCRVFGMNQLLNTLDPRHPRTFFPHLPTPNEIAFLQHSSGTTGLQKGVALTHEAVLNHVASYSDALELTPQDVIISWLPLYHDMGLIAGFLLPLIQGIPLVLMSPFDWVAHPALLLKAIHQYHGTLCWLPNFAYNHMARRIRQRDSEPWSLASMRAFINCSEPVRHDSHQLFLARFAANGAKPEMLAVSYAMAENTFAVTQTYLGQPPLVDWVDREALENQLQALPVSQPSERSVLSVVSCGAPIADVAVKVMDGLGQTLLERQVGEIAIHSNSMLRGYYQRDDLQPLDAQGWYATGDRGYIANGEVYIIGRSKDLIINAGKNIYPQDIEAIINTVVGIHPGRAVVFGVPDEKEGTELLAVVAEIDHLDPVLKQQLTHDLKQAVVRQAEVTLTYVTLVEAGWLIKTSSGKIARNQNRAKWLAQRAAP
jgi:acyl-CoA synthetase (AMP-forming)/AMP-acid ligase II